MLRASGGGGGPPARCCPVMAPHGHMQGHPRAGSPRATLAQPHLLPSAGTWPGHCLSPGAAQPPAGASAGSPCLQSKEKEIWGSAGGAAPRLGLFPAPFDVPPHASRAQGLFGVAGPRHSSCRGYGDGRTAGARLGVRWCPRCLLTYAVQDPAHGAIPSAGQDAEIRSVPEKAQPGRGEERKAVTEQGRGVPG